MMNETDPNYGLLTETSTISETRNERWQRHLPNTIGFVWLRAGWRDMAAQPALSLGYGLGMFVVSVAVIALIVAYQRDYALFPALTGFLIVGPLFALGLYEKSRLRERGERITLRQMLYVKPAAGAQIYFIGVLLCLLMVLWIRAAVLIYALFFGVRPFPGLELLASFLVSEPIGWALLLVGSVVGGLFAAFAFAISVFSIPMLLDKRVDALTAMGSSTALVWNNLWPMIVWGGIVLVLFALCAATGLLALIAVFPLVGHATWHAYRTVSLPEG